MPRIALVGEKPANRLLVEMLLDEDYELVFYSDRPATWGSVAAGKPDLVVVGVGVQDRHGMAMVHSLRADDQTRFVPLIALNAEVHGGEQDLYLSLGCNAYISNPATEAQICAVIRGMLQQVALDREQLANANVARLARGNRGRSAMALACMAAIALLQGVLLAAWNAGPALWFTATATTTLALLLITPLRDRSTKRVLSLFEERAVSMPAGRTQRGDSWSHLAWEGVLDARGTRRSANRLSVQAH